MAKPSTPPIFPPGMPLYRVIGGFAGAGGLSHSGANIQADYFSGADVASTGPFDVVSESNVTPTLVSQIAVFADGNLNGLIDSNDRAVFTFVVKVFISREASYLQRAYAECVPDPNEVCFFLEDNSSDVFSDRFASILIGSVFAECVDKLRLLRGAFHSQSEWFGVPSGTGPFAGLDFMSSEIDQLIREGRIENAARDTWISLIKIANLQTMLLGPAYSVLGKGILDLTKELRQRIKFTGRHWDPEDPAYDPVLGNIPGTAIEVFEDLTSESIQAMADSAKQVLHQRATELSKVWKKLLQSGLATVVPSPLLDTLDGVPRIADACVDRLLRYVDRAMQTLSALGSRALSAANAYFCGLWNGLAEAVLGMLDLIGYVLVALGGTGAALSGAERHVPAALELLDEAIQAIRTVDWPGLFDAAITALVNGIRRFNLFALTSELSIERVAYFVGGVAGLLVEIIVGLFSSGGIGSVRAVAAKFGRVGSEVFEAIRRGATRIVGSTATFSIEELLRLLRGALALTRQGKAAVAAAIERLFLLLDNLARLGDDVFERIRRLLNLTDEEIRLMEAAQLRFVGLTDDAAQACLVTF